MSRDAAVKMPAKFTQNSIWKHVITMTLSNSVGLMAMFLVDLIDLYFLNLLDISYVTAAIGFSAQLSFYLTALSIGFLITSGVMVSTSLGRGEHSQAVQVGTHIVIFSAILVGALSLLFYYYLENFLALLGAQSDTLILAVEYTEIILFSSVILVISMTCSGILRAVGDAKRSMFVTLISAIVNLVLDPIFIFVFDWGVQGAAYATVVARVVMMSYAVYCVIKVHNMLEKPNIRRAILIDFTPIMKIAMPNLLTNLATPIGSSLIILMVSDYGDSAVAGYVVIGRIIPVAFSVLFALSGAISPIIGQNFGAKKINRVVKTYQTALIFACVFVVFVSLILFLLKPVLIGAFNLSGDGAMLVSWFCSGLSLFFIADAILFSTNSAFNSLGYPIYSTISNYAKYFLGVIPCIYLLSYWFGLPGLAIGLSVGTVFVTTISVTVCQKIMLNLSA